MSSTFDNLIFRSGKNGVTFQIFSDIGCRKSKPSVDQKATEEYVLSIHKKLMVIGAYQSISFSLDDIDHYDEGFDHYVVPGASMQRGDRRVRNDEWTKTSIPKSWSSVITARFGPMIKMNRPISILTEVFQTPGVDPAEVIINLKKHKYCEYFPVYVERRGYSEHSGKYKPALSQ